MTIGDLGGIFAVSLVISSAEVVSYLKIYEWMID